MNPNLCRCSGVLEFKKIDGVTKVNNVSCFDFHFTCLKCGQTVIHSRFPTVLGYITVRVQNLGVVSA
jgi:hypothetical protein